MGPDGLGIVISGLGTNSGGLGTVSGGNGLAIDSGGLGTVPIGLGGGRTGRIGAIGVYPPVGDGMVVEGG